MFYIFKTATKVERNVRRIFGMKARDSASNWLRGSTVACCHSEVEFKKTKN